MADFTASQLERLAASAYDLVANAFLGEPSTAGLQGQKLEPVCTEPYCGGWYWEESASWSPEAVPPLGVPRGATKHTESDLDAGPPAPEPPAKQVADALAEKPLDKLDYTGADFYPALDKPIATRVKLQPANNDEWPWYMANHAKEITLGMDRHGHTSIVVGNRHREELLDHLDNFLRMDQDLELEGQLIPKGSRVLTVKPDEQPLRVAPWVGSKDDLRRSPLPLRISFGKPGTPSTMPERPDWPKAEPLTLPVKRLDVVLRKTRQGLKDFLPPLLQAKEPEMESIEDLE